jgi:HEAT repeat protein
VDRRRALTVLRGQIAICALLSTIPCNEGLAQESRPAKELIAHLASDDPGARTRAACELRELGDRAVDAIAPLVRLLADGSPVEGTVCGRRWSQRGDDALTSPGEEAAAALAAIGTRAFQPVLGALRHDAWIARRNAAWALGALDDNRAVASLAETLRDREAPVREQAAWALGAIDDTQAVPALAAALKDPDARVRKQSAWALGALDDSRAVPDLIQALSDSDDKTRSQAAWALGAIGDSRALAGLLVALKDDSVGVRRQAAWAIGAIGR